MLVEGPVPTMPVEVLDVLGDDHLLVSTLAFPTSGEVLRCAVDAGFHTNWVKSRRRSMRM